jgi:two-component system NtrC family response regulator
VVAATNSDLRERVRAGAFREDLLYRLEFLHLEVPALKLRGGDIELLAKHFLADASGHILSPRAVQALYAHDWPGNVRELRHRIERAGLMAQGPLIEPIDLGLPVSAPSPSPGHAAPPCGQGAHAIQDLWQLIERDGLSLAQALERCERLLIEAALAAERDNRTRAAQRLGIHVRTIFKKLSR